MSADMALRLGRLLGNGPGVWLRMQQAVDLWELEHSRAAEYARIEKVAA